MLADFLLLAARAARHGRAMVAFPCALVPNVAVFEAKLRHSAPRPIYTMQNGGSQVAIVGVRLLMF